MIQHYITVALRNLRKYPAQSIISVLGLAAGFVCLSLSALWMRYENTYDTMHEDYERIYTFTKASSLEYAGSDFSSNRLIVPSTLARTLKSEYPEGAFADEIVKDHPEYSLPSVRMTLIGLEKKSKVSKIKAEYEGKEKTKYTFVTE